jgi:hemerythrin-like domain-containing protein
VKEEPLDAITMLRDDHATARDLFKRFEAAGKGALKTKRKIVDRIIEELAVHAAVEEQVFYPAVRTAIEEAEDEVLESLEEHHIVKWTLSELDGMDPADERFDPKVTVLIENVRHHMKEEEGEMFPRVRKALGATELTELGGRMLEAKKAAPRRPHPRSPDTPPGNLVTGPIAAVLDAGRDALSRVRGKK